MELYRDPIPSRLVLEGVAFDGISMEQSVWLERPFSEEEVKLALNSMEEDKAPGLDGFFIMFLKVCWDVVGKEAMTIFDSFHSNDQWCKSLSATFITLIPKKKGVTQVKDYQPISLLGCLYKLLAKMQVVRLKTILPTIILDS